MSFLVFLAFGLVCVALLLSGVWLERPTLLALGKAGASLTLVCAAVAAPTHASYYGVRVCAAVGLAFIGDMLLLREGEAALQGAIGVFLLGHLAYIDAFLHQGVFGPWLGLALAVILVPSASVQMWLWPHVAPRLKGPVWVYLLVITVMLASTIGSAPYAVAPVLQILGAALFYLSDVCVARDAFIVKSRVNAMVGLPLYYAAQWLFVASLGY